MISPKRVAVQAALRTLQLSGDSQSTLETAYATGLTALDGGDIPVSGLRDATLAAEAEIAELIANDKANPYRQMLYGRSANLATAAAIPVVDNGGVSFIGVFSGAIDVSDNTPLTEFTIQEFQRFQRKGTSRYTCAYRHYKLWSGRIYHTVTNAYLEGCIWDRTAALARFDVGSSSTSPLPDSMEATWVARTIEFLVMEGWLQNEGSYYGNFVQSGVARLKGRTLEGPTMPDHTSSAMPARN